MLSGWRGWAGTSLCGLALLSGCGQDQGGAKDQEQIRPLPEAYDDDGAGWERFPGPRPTPSFPCALAATVRGLVLATGRTLWLFDPAKRSWELGSSELPSSVGRGLSLYWDEPRGRLLILPGASAALWAWTPGTSRVAVLKSPPAPVGRGACVSGNAERIFVVRGGGTREIWQFDTNAEVWSSLPDVGGPVKVARLGVTTGLVCAFSDAVYALPDHHVQRFDLETSTWGSRTWSSLGFRPHWDGGALVRDADAGLIYFAQGMASRALGVYRPEKKKFHYLRPRAPEAVSGEGQRLAILGKSQDAGLWLYLPKPTNALWRTPLAAAVGVTKESPAPEVGSPYETFHEGDGASLVRHQGIEGAMGPLGERLWFLRLRNARVFDPAKDTWTRYPGFDLGRVLKPGLCGVADGDRALHMFPGGSSDFLRVDLETGAVEELPKTPAPVGLGAGLARVAGNVFALRGQETRDVWRFDLAASRWVVSPSLPKNTTPIGRIGGGPLSDGRRILVGAGSELLALDPSENGWRTLGALGFACEGDGGMAAYHPGSRALYLVQGGGGRRLGRFDLDAGRFELLKPPLPDGVSVSGNRLVVTERDGATWLLICRGHDSHEMWRVRLSDLHVEKAR